MTAIKNFRTREDESANEKKICWHNTSILHTRVGVKPQATNTNHRERLTHATDKKKNDGKYSGRSTREAKQRKAMKECVGHPTVFPNILISD